MNIKQSIVFGVTLGFILGSIGLWGITGFQVFTKMKVPVEVIDPLFGTRSIEWKKKFVFGLDYAGPVTGAGALLGGTMFYALRTKKKS
jgi:hypothetical protein